LTLCKTTFPSLIKSSHSSQSSANTAHQLNQLKYVIMVIMMSKFDQNRSEQTRIFREKEIRRDETRMTRLILTHRSARFRCLALVVFVAIEFYHSLPPKLTSPLGLSQQKNLKQFYSRFWTGFSTLIPSPFTLARV
jgi:hypothetical protein